MAVLLRGLRRYGGQGWFKAGAEGRRGVRKAGFMTLLNGANRDYGHILRERPCAFGKAHHRALAKRQSKRPNLGKRAYVGKPGACSLLDFYRIKDAVVLYENVNLGTGFISIEPKTGLLATVPASFEQFADDMGFEHRAAHGSVRQRFWRGPSRKIAAKPRVREIELWSLDDPGSDIARIWSEQIHEARRAEYAEPVTRRGRADAYVAREFRNVEELPRPCGGGLEKSKESVFVCDAREVVHVPFQIGADVRAEECLPVLCAPRGKRWERPSVDAMVNFGNSAKGCLGVDGVWNQKGVVTSSSELLSLGDPAKVEDTDPSSKRFACVSHQMKLLGTGEPELSAHVRVAVNCHLDKRQNLGSILQFVNNDWRRIGLEEKCGVFSCEGTYVRVVKRHKCTTVFGSAAQKSRFPDLPCTTDKNGRELGRQFLDGSQCSSFYKFHDHIVSYSNAFCNRHTGLSNYTGVNLPSKNAEILGTGPAPMRDPHLV